MRMRTYHPRYVDHFQAPSYRLVRYTVESDGRVLAHFADGSSRESIYPTEAALLQAAEGDWRERVRLAN